MPEGPEILITSQYLKTKLKKKKIKSIQILGGRYIHQNLKGFDLTKSTPLIVEMIDSKGKFLWMRLTDKNGKSIYMMNTFGMTGRWSFRENPSSRLKIVVQSNTDPSKKYDLYYVDPRNFGTIEFTSNELLLQKKLDKLAPDVLKTQMNDGDLMGMIRHFISTSRKDKNLVKVLMDQEAIVSGIGNYLVAEILYDAKLNPHRNIDDLSVDEMKTLAHSIRKISKIAYYDNNSGYMEHFKIFMKTHSAMIDSGVFPNYHPDIKTNKKFKFKVYQQEKDPHGNDVENDQIVKDRTIHWVKAVQM
jgi:DNA-formamidopyrimidine glycosylase